MEFLKTLIAYNFAEHRELWATIGALDETVFLKDTGYSAGTIQRTVVHNIRADRLTLNCAMELSAVALLPYETVDRHNIRAAWDALEHDVKDFAEALPDQTAQHRVTYTAANGHTHEVQVGELLLHICNHGTVHRAEICAMLHMLGQPINFDVSLRRYLANRAGD